MTIKKIGTLAAMRRRLAIVVAAVSLATAGMAVTSSQASQAAKAQCPKHNLCVWVDAGYKGRIMVTIGSQAELGGLPDPRNNFNNQISAIWNRTNKNVCLYSKAHFEGRRLVFGPGMAFGNLGRYNDWASSIRVGCAI